MDTQFDSESYWNRSSSAAFSFDDDDGNDSAGTSTEFDFTNLSNAIFNDDAISEASFDNSATLGSLNVSIKSIISDEALKLLLQEQTLDDRVLPKGVSPEEELKLLRRQIQSTLYSPSAEATAYKLLRGKSAPLEVFKSLHEKQELLDTLLHNGGGDAVISVLLFLKRTLHATQFHNILQQRPKALEHYISYLRQSGELSSCIDVLQRFGRSQEAALLQFQAAMGVSDLATRKQQLQRLADAYANAGVGIVPIYEQIFHSALKLQLFIEKERGVLGKELNEQATPIELLYACCQRNNNWKEQDMLKLISPQRFAADQQISAAQYEWTALTERSRAQAYADLECIFERVPSWNPMKSKQFHVSFDLTLAVQRLYELQAPSSVLQLFLSKMSNSSEKLELAQRVKCIKGVVDAMAGLKQLQELQLLKETLPERSEEQFYCENALKTLQSKRWTTDSIKLKL